MIDGIGSDIAMEGSVESAYAGTPLAPALSLFEGVDAVRAELGEIRCPTLLLSSREDHVVAIRSPATSWPARWAGPLERVFLERSFHVATLDWDAPLHRGARSWPSPARSWAARAPLPPDGRAASTRLIPGRRGPRGRAWPGST